MSHAERLETEVVSAQVNGDFTEAVLQLSDGTRLCFCHRVGERWAKAVGPEEAESEAGLAGEFLEAVQQFRLNARHLEILFKDASRWEDLFR